MFLTLFGPDVAIHVWISRFRHDYRQAHNY